MASFITFNDMACIKPDSLSLWHCVVPYKETQTNNTIYNGHVQKSRSKSTQIAPLGLNEKKVFFKPKLFHVCANFTKFGLEIRARVISQGVIIFFTSIRGERSELIWSNFCTSFCIIPSICKSHLTKHTYSNMLACVLATLMNSGIKSFKSSPYMMGPVKVMLRVSVPFKAGDQ